MPLIYHFRPATPNIGNDLIVFALHELMAQAANKPYDLMNMPAKGVSAVIKSGGITRQTVNDINQLGSGVLIGPGNLFENNGLEVDPVALDALRFAPLIFSVSWGRIFDDQGELHPRTDAMGREAIAALCRKSSSVLVRDARTRDYLQSLGVDRLHVIGCPVLTLQPDRLPLPAPDPRAQDAVIISVRNPLLMNISPRLQGRVHLDVHRLIEKLRSMGQRKIALLCHDPRDLRFAAAYADVPVLYTESPLQYLSWLRDCRLSITFRLHSFLPCAVFGTPSVHFSYDERAVGLIETANLQECDVNYVRSADPVEQALAMVTDPDSIRRAVEAARPTWCGLQDLMCNELSTWLHGLEQ
ncbi:MAG: polysaccharide pyruvyl transferase family protein [Anaerolineae bacterium]|nr:polysaccharide pyruvyl transferase family protein [Anaerolineae bacterium]